MRQKHYLVTLSASVLADTTVAVRADSEEEAARLALEGADYDMEKWLNYYECDPLVEPTACDVPHDSEGPWDTAEYLDDPRSLRYLVRLRNPSPLLVERNERLKQLSILIEK